jgi:methylenetetrahydrofolate--tRNA-(uracil-5-)-methyltransferase
MSTLPVVVIGGGLAGTEAAYQIARRGLPVQLYEMRPQRQTLAHQTDLLGELVCSNSLKADTLSSAHGLLKAELRQLGSVVLQAADASRVPAGAALAVDRVQFAQYLTATISQHPNITLVRQEVVALPAEQLTIVATGPLTSPALTAHLQARLGDQHLYFYDALSPIVAADSIDESKTFLASRYDIGDGDDYLNCPLDRPTYEDFCAALVAAECVKPHTFEREIFFEGCLPIEEMARRGPQTLAFGPLKPVGLRRSDMSTPYAVVQLRLEDALRRAYNMVGFQTRLTYAEQRRVFRMIPGLEQAEFLRLGAVHRNTFLNAPRLLLPTLQSKHAASLLFAGQITGVEGYVESAATGLLAGLNAVALHCGTPLLVPPPTTAHGALVHYIALANPETFQPMNIHFGLLPPLDTAVHPKKARRAAMIARALADLQAWQGAVAV